MCGGEAHRGSGFVFFLSAQFFLWRGHAHQVSFPGADPDGAELAEDLLLPCAVATATMLAAALAFVIWGLSGASGKASSNSGQGFRPASSTDLATSGSIQTTGSSGPSAGTGSAALRWLGSLLAATTGLFVAQVALGLLVRSLTLLADSAHVGADALTYAFSYFVEHAKARATGRLGDAAAAAAERLDALSAAFSMAVVIGTSMCAMLDAMRRLGLLDGGTGRPGVALAEADVAPLRRPSPQSTDIEDGPSLGAALLFFALVSLAANCGLVVLHRRRVASAAAASAVEASESLLTASAASAPLPPPPPPPPPPLHAPPPPGAEGAEQQRGDRRRGRRRESIAWLHQAFHPGCDPSGCHLSGGAAASTEASVNADGGRPAPEENLNVSGALLHLVADVLRSLVILVAGVLLQCGLFTDAAKVDAVCALTVSALIIAGSLAMVRDVVTALCRSFCRREVARPLPPPKTSQQPWRRQRRRQEQQPGIV